MFPVKETHVRIDSAFKGFPNLSQSMLYSLQIDVSLPYVCPVIHNEFRHNIIEAAVDGYFYNVMTKFTVSNRKDA